MKKNSYIIFIINEIITIIIQYFLICFFFYYIFKTTLLVSLIITLTILLLCSLITYSTYKKLNNLSFEDTEKEKIESELTKYNSYKIIIEDIISNVNKKYNTNLIVKYVIVDEFGPAWITKNIVFINVKYLFLESLLKGVIGHEIGHYFTKVCKYTFFDSIKIGSMISRIFRYLYLIIYNKKHKKSFLFTIVYFLYIIFSIFDIIFIYKIMKKDEIKANNFAVELGYGNELKCYYGAYCLKYYTKDQEILDLMHPSVKLMIDIINKNISSDIYNKNIYISDNKIYYAVIDTKTYIVPNSITSIENNTLYSDTLIKINLNNVNKIEYNIFNNTPNIETIIIYNDINVGVLKRLKRLKELTIYNKELYDKLIQDNYFNNIKITLKNNK